MNPYHLCASFDVSLGYVGLVEKLFSETCDERALPLVGSRSESVWKGGSRGGVAGGWNAACQSLVTWYIPGQIVQTAAPQALTEN
jgi:hypothetical protein